MNSILIVDDHAAFRQQARALLEAEGLDVVGEAANAAEAIEAVRSLRPDIVLLDIGLPDRDGFAVADQLARDGAGARVILISSREAADFPDRLAASPAIGFVQKDDLSAQALAELLREG